MHGLASFDESHLLSDRGDGIANLVNGAQQFVFRHPQMPDPAANSRRIVHVDVASGAAALDRSSADHRSDSQRIIAEKLTSSRGSIACVLSDA